MTGNFATVYDSVGDGVVGAPKKSMGQVHPLPSEKADFSWRIRNTVFNGKNVPHNDVLHEGLPSTYLEFGWSDTDLNYDLVNRLWLPSGETVSTAMVERNVNP
jgi:hypothetical protein